MPVGYDGTSQSVWRSILTTWFKKQGRWKTLFEDALRRAQLPLSLISHGNWKGGERRMNASRLRLSDFLILDPNES